MSLNLILVGCGNMGFSMLSSWLKTGIVKASDVFVIEPVAELRKRAEVIGVATVSGVEDIANVVIPKLVVFAVKPQSIQEVLVPYRSFADGRTTFLSVAAGVPLSTFERVLGTSAPIMRCMPNMSASIGKGMTVCMSNTLVTEEARVFVARLLQASGQVEAVDDEGMLNAVTAISGSGPAYVFYFIESLAAAAEELGLCPDFAMRLARQTVYGAACLAAEPQADPAELRRLVTSPNGTTAAAMAILMESDSFKKVLTSAAEAARRRSVELTLSASIG